MNFLTRLFEKNKGTLCYIGSLPADKLGLLAQKLTEKQADSKRPLGVVLMGQQEENWQKSVLLAQELTRETENKKPSIWVDCSSSGFVSRSRTLKILAEVGLLEQIQGLAYPKELLQYSADYPKVKFLSYGGVTGDFLPKTKQIMPALQELTQEGTVIAYFRCRNIRELVALEKSLPELRFLVTGPQRQLKRVMLHYTSSLST